MIEIECDNQRQVDALLEVINLYKDAPNPLVVIDSSHPLWEFVRRQIVLWKIRRSGIEIRREGPPITRTMKPVRRVYDAPFEWSHPKKV